MKWAYLVGALGIAGTFISDIWLDIDYDMGANVSLIYIAVLATIFAVRYAVWSKWWTNRIGKIYVIKSIILALVLAQAVVSVWCTDDYPGRGMIRFAIYSSGAIAFLPMIVSLVREQRRDRKRLN